MLPFLVKQHSYKRFPPYRKDKQQWKRKKVVPSSQTKWQIRTKCKEPTLWRWMGKAYRYDFLNPNLSSFHICNFKALTYVQLATHLFNVQISLTEDFGKIFINLSRCQFYIEWQSDTPIILITSDFICIWTQVGKRSLVNLKVLQISLNICIFYMHSYYLCTSLLSSYILLIYLEESFCWQKDVEEKLKWISCVDTFVPK